MERERINCESVSRTIQQRNNIGGSYMVDYRSDKNQHCLSNSTLQKINDEEEETLQGLFETPIQRVEDEDDTLQGKFDGTIQKKNETGMPDNLKAGIESLSGFSLDDVRVNYNSSKPATVQALAYTQGTDIHFASGQEKNLLHEAWHVAQQMTGRVSPTTSINGMPVNDNVELEHEADVMREKAKAITTPIQLKEKNNVVRKNVFQLKLAKEKLNVVGEEHNISNRIRNLEKSFVFSEIPDGKYWEEYKFVFRDKNKDVYGDSPILRLNFAFGFSEDFFYKYSSIIDEILDNPKKNIHAKFPELEYYINTLKNHMLLIQGELIGFKKSFSNEEITSMYIFIQKTNESLDYIYQDFLWLKTPANQIFIEEVKHKRFLIKEKYNIINRLFKTFKKQFYFSNPLEIVAKQRSDHMHEIANSKSSEHGVWKIGESHSNDLTQKNEKDRKYNLISKEQFAQELDEYTSKKNLIQVSEK